MKSPGSWSFLSRLLAITALVLTSLSPLLAQHFRVDQGTLYDPAGHRFTPYGGNVNGGNYFDWGCPNNDWLQYESSVMFSEDAINKLLNGWRWNFLRANVFLKDPTWGGYYLCRRLAHQSGARRAPP